MSEVLSRDIILLQIKKKTKFSILLHNIPEPSHQRRLCVTDYPSLWIHVLVIYENSPVETCSAGKRKESTNGDTNGVGQMVWEHPFHQCLIGTGVSMDTPERTVLLRLRSRDPRWRTLSILSMSSAEGSDLPLMMDVLWLKPLDSGESNFSPSATGPGFERTVMIDRRKL